MAKATHRKLLRKYGGYDTKNHKNIAIGEVQPAEHKSVPMMYKGTRLIVRVVAGQQINPKKEYERQLGINKKRAKKMRAKELKAKKLEHA